MRISNDYEAKTRYNSRDEFVWVLGGKEKSSSQMQYY
jgi:hypothetical protein